MKPQVVASLLLVLAFWTAGAIHAQISDPIPTPIPRRGLSVEITDVARVPDTRGLRPAGEGVMPAGWARVSYVRELPDGRRFANDSRACRGISPMGRCSRPTSG